MPLLDELDVWRPPASEESEPWRTRLDRAVALAIPTLPLDSVVSQLCVALDEAHEWEAAFRLDQKKPDWQAVFPRLRGEIIASFDPWQNDPRPDMRRREPEHDIRISSYSRGFNTIPPIPFNEADRAEADRMVEDLGRMMDQCMLSAFHAATRGDPVPVPVPEQPAYETDRAKLRRLGIRKLHSIETNYSGQVFGNSQGEWFHVGQTMATVKTSNDEEEFWRATDRYRQHDGHACPCPICQRRWNDQGVRIDRQAQAASPSAVELRRRAISETRMFSVPILDYAVRVTET